ncbi:hypothetical protein ACQ4PT_021904 [Festuca glaucescens]
MALALRAPRFQPLSAYISATSTSCATSARSSSSAPAAICAAASPSTEATSSSRYRRDAWSYTAQDSSAASATASGRRDDEIALQLPELRGLLKALNREGEEIHELLLTFAEAGANVVRLKGGDPLVFGRGGEEMDFLQQQGIRVEVVPGITSASGIAAEFGIPLTHRGVATSVRFLTGHSRNGGTDPLFVAENAADPDTTLVVYMGLSTLPFLAPRLMKHGLPPNTPAIAVESGTTPNSEWYLQR